MRFDTPIYFQTVKKGEYDPETGNYAEDTVTEDKVFASVTDSRAETLNLVYGSIKQGSKTVRLQNHYSKPFDRIRIGEKLYRVDFSRKLKLKHIFVVSEVQ
jgi:hypothetical protein